MSLVGLEFEKAVEISLSQAAVVICAKAKIVISVECTRPEPFISS